MKLQTKEDDKNIIKRPDQSVITMETNIPKFKQELQNIHLVKETMEPEKKEASKDQVQPSRRRRHKHHRSDEYPVYNKDGSRSILAQLLQDESQSSGKSGQLATTPMSKSMDNLHLYKQSTSGMPVLKTVDFPKSTSQETVKRRFTHELPKVKKASSQLGRASSMNARYSMPMNVHRTCIEQEIVSVAKTTDLDSPGLDGDQRPPPPDYPGHSALMFTFDPAGQEAAASCVNVDAINSNFEQESNNVGISGSPQEFLLRKDESDDNGSERSSNGANSGNSGEWSTLDHQAISERATQMVEILSDENAALRQELDNYYQKVSKLQKFEQDIQQVQNSYEQLAKSTAKREHLERVMRMKLESEFKRTQENNKELQAHVLALKTQLQQNVSPLSTENEQQKGELRKRDTIIAQLIIQHKEHLSNKARVEVELAAQRATLSEQRTHIDVLDTALSNAQTNVVRLQEESQRKQIYVDRVEKLQQALGAIQNASDQREGLEKKLRLKLEKEIEILRAHQRAVASQEHDEGVSLESPNNSQALIELLKERDEKIMFLEAEVTKWEQRYLQEFAMRQCVDPPSPGLNQKYSLSPQRSAEYEEREFMNEKVRHMEELLEINKRCSGLESHLKALTTDVTEKQAFITVLQQQSLEKDRALSSLERLLRGSASPQGSSQNIAQQGTWQHAPQGSWHHAPQGSWQHAPQGSSLQNIYPGYSPLNMTTMHASLPSVSQGSPQNTSQGSLHNLLYGSPQNTSQGSLQNVHMSYGSPQNTSQGSLHNVHLSYGSLQNMSPGLTLKHAGKGLGSQERVMGLSNSYSSLNSSNPMLTIDVASDNSLDKMRDDRIKELDRELAQQDSILQTLPVPSEGRHFWKM